MDREKIFDDLISVVPEEYKTQIYNIKERFLKLPEEDELVDMIQILSVILICSYTKNATLLFPAI